MELNGKEVRSGYEGDVMRYAMKDRGMMQVDLADKLGMLQSAISGSMNRKRITMEAFKRILNAMDYDVAVVDRRNGEVKWIVSPEK